MKLELKHIAPYLPYNLQVEYKGEVTFIGTGYTTNYKEYIVQFKYYQT